jgi:transketolase
MSTTIPQLGEELSNEQIKLLETFTKSARQSILQMVTNAQSGHPGGALSCIDYIATLYAFRVGQTGEKVVVSNGHVSPCVYATLAEMGYIPRTEVIETFRKVGSIYEGHITRHVDGIEYGTGPLGVGVSVASAFALAEKKKGTDQKSYFLMGDGECQEGQVHEMINFSKHYKLNNLIGFIDYNKVQLTASMEETMDIDVIATFKAGSWHVIEIDAHNYQEIWKAISEANSITDKPVVIVGHSIMGKGSPFMEPAGHAIKPEWHGKAPSVEDIASDIELLQTSEEETALLEDFRTNNVTWKPEHSNYPEKLSTVEINTGTPIINEAGTVTDCRGAYGKALLDLAKLNPQIVAFTADVKGSVKTDGVSKELPEQYIECGIAEQHMISAAGAFSIDNFIPFASTFGAFIASRAKDQARVNDINYCNVKMVATHCGLSVGEDGPTHQAIDDMGSFLGFYNTNIVEPADANQCDHIIRYVASHYGNFYVRMGRHKFAVLTKEDGTPFYDSEYKYQYGRSDVIREGVDITIAASGAMVTEALLAREALEGKLSIEVIAVSSIKEFDETLLNSIKKTGKLITAEDHNPACGLGTTLPAHLTEKSIPLKAFKAIGVREYQLSGKSAELYKVAGIDSESIAKACEAL